MEVFRAPARPQKCVIVQSVACGTRAVLEHNNMYVIWSLRPLCIALKLLFLKKNTVFLVFTFACTFLICGRKLQFIELKWSRQFSHNNQIYFCKKLSCHTEQHLFGCPLGGATLATVSIMNPLSPCLHYTNPPIAFFEHCKVKGAAACAVGVCCFWLCRVCH